MQKQKKSNCIADRVMSMFNRGIISSQTDLFKFDFGLSIDEYFKFILPLLLKSPDSRTESEKELIFGFFCYFKDFIHLMNNLNGDKYQEILKTLVGYMTCIKHPNNKIIIQQGDKTNKVYLMLNGSADVIIPKRYKYALTLSDYYRYLAKLIIFKEYELLSRVLFENSQIYPIEIIDCGLFGRINGFRKKSNDQFAINSISTANLEMYLTIEDKKLIAQLVKNKNSQSLAVSELSTKDYIERIEIKPSIIITQHNNDSNSIYNQSLNQVYSLNIYNYIKQGSITSGQSFNDVVLINSKSIRTSTVISSSQCYLSLINKEAYVFSVNKTQKRSNKKLLFFILSSSIFVGITAGILSTNYKKYFKVITVKKNDYVLLQNEPNENIIMLKEGCYELTIQCSIADMSQIVQTLFNCMKRDKKNINSALSELAQSISWLLKEEEIINEKQNDYKHFKAFYHEKRQFKLFTISPPSYFGFEKLELKSNENYYDLHCISLQGEYLQIEKSKYNGISRNDTETQSYEASFCNGQNEKMITRLMSIRDSLMQRFIQKNNITFLSRQTIEENKHKNDDRVISYFNDYSELKAKNTFLLASKNIKALLPSVTKNKEKGNRARRKSSLYTKFIKDKRVNRSYNENSFNKRDIRENSPCCFQLKDRTQICKPIDDQLKAFRQLINVKKNDKLARCIDNSFSIINDEENISKDNVFKCSLKSRFIRNLPSQFDSSFHKSVSMEDYKEMKENEYRIKRNYYLIKSTRDFFLKRKQSIRLSKSISSANYSKKRSAS